MENNADLDVNDRVIRNQRTLAATPREIFAAFQQPELLAQWWGPHGFTNTFKQFDFVPGGRWDFTMHSPDGHDFANDSFFREIEPDARIVIEHVVNPWFLLTVTWTPTTGGTRIDWHQEFESSEVATRMRPLANKANEQVFDRLAALLESVRSAAEPSTLPSL